MVTRDQNRENSSFMSDLERDACVLMEHDGVRSVAMHSHEFLELSYILKGSAEHTLDGVTETLRVGDYLIVDYGSRHSYVGSGDGHFDNVDCLFLAELLDPVLKGTKSLRAVLEHYLLHFNMKALAQNPARMVFHDNSGQILKLLKLIDEESKKREAGYIALIRCYLIEILLLTMRRLDDARVAATGQDIGALIIAYVSEHYMEPLTLQDLAQRLNYSLPYISKRFKTDVGISFVNYLQNYRVMQACRLLSSSNRTISEIAEMVGYHDIKFFSEIVKRNTGLSPADFRRQRKL